MIALWSDQSLLVKCFLLGFLALIFAPAVRFVISARHLVRRGGNDSIPNDVLPGEVDPQRVECRRVYLLRRCKADAALARRASVVVCMLSLVMIAFDAFPTYVRGMNDTNHTGTFVAFLMVKDYLDLLGYVWAFSALLYSAATVVERAAVERLMNWKYFSTSVRTELSND